MTPPTAPAEEIQAIEDTGSAAWFWLGVSALVLFGLSIGVPVGMILG